MTRDGEGVRLRIGAAPVVPGKELAGFSILQRNTQILADFAFHRSPDNAQILSGQACFRNIQGDNLSRKLLFGADGRAGKQRQHAA